MRFEENIRSAVARAGDEGDIELSIKVSVTEGERSFWYTYKVIRISRVELDNIADFTRYCIDRGKKEINEVYQILKDVGILNLEDECRIVGKDKISDVFIQVYG